MTEFRGIYPALVTASTADGGVSVPGVEALVEYLIGKGVDGLYVGGTTGEGIYMTGAERQLLAETVLKRVNGRIGGLMHRCGRCGRNGSRNRNRFRLRFGLEGLLGFAIGVEAIGEIGGRWSRGCRAGRGCGRNRGCRQ